MMLSLRVWLTSNAALAVAGAAAFVAAAVVSTLALAQVYGMPAVNVALLVLIPLSLTGFLTGPRRRPVWVRAVTVPVEPLAMVPGTVAPHPTHPLNAGWGATNTPSRYFPAGWAQRPAAARLSPASAAAGPELVGVTR